MTSIIIPTRNEGEFLSEALGAIHATGAAHDYEVLVVDARSSDATIAVAAAHGARILSSPIQQRAAQMNLGAAQAQGDVLLFLHADTMLPVGALAGIETALAHPRVAGGAFARRYHSDSVFLRVTCALAYWRGRLSGWFLGDQAIFVRAEIFQKLGGFEEWPLFEDLDFSRRLRAEGRTVMLRPPVISAARRFESLGPWRTTWSDFLLTCRYLAGGASAGSPKRRDINDSNISRRAPREVA